VVKLLTGKIISKKNINENFNMGIFFLILWAGAGFEPLTFMDVNHDALPLS
jgi:hypothetical protein